MSQPSSSDVHVNRPLTNISIAFLQAKSDFVSTLVFPEIPVTKQANKYFVYTKKQWFRTDAKKRAPGTESAGTGFDLTTQTYFADVNAIHKDVDDPTRANQDSPIDLDRDASELVTRDLMLQKEKDFVTQFMTTGQWGTDFTPSALWSVAGSDPIGDIRAQSRLIKSRTGFKPNTLVLSPDTKDILSDHADILNRIKFTQRGVLTDELLAAIFNVDRVISVEAVEDANPEGAAEALGHISSKNGLLVYSEPNPGPLKPSGGYTFSWSGLTGSQNGMRIKKFRMEHLESDRVEGEYAYDQKLVAPELGVFLSGAIA